MPAVVRNARLSGVLMSPARIAAGLAACLFVLSAAAEPLSEAALAEARALRERALADDTAYELVRSLTTEVGPRLPGSPGDARAVAWSLAKLSRGSNFRASASAAARNPGSDGGRRE